MTFEEIGIEERLVKAVTDLGYVNPTTIQEKAIPVLLERYYRLYRAGTNRHW